MLNTVRKSLLSLLLLSGSLVVADEGAENSHFSSEDIFQLEYVSDPQISPNGDHVIYVRRSNDVMTDRTRSNLWIVDTESGDHRPLLSGANQFSSPRWSKDGSKIAYVSNSEGARQIFVRWMDTGQTAMISNLQHSPFSISWSPDGKWIAYSAEVLADEKVVDAKMPKKPKGAEWSEPVKYVSRTRYQADGRGILDPTFRHIFIIPSLGGTPRQITDGPFNHGGKLAWTMDSERIIFSANRNDDWEYTPGESDLWSVSPRSGNIVQLTDLPGAESSPEMSADGNDLAFLNRSGKKVSYSLSALTIMDLDSGDTRTILDDLDRRINTLNWSGKDIVIQFQDRGKSVLGKVNTSGTLTRLANDLGGTSIGRPYLSGDYSVSEKGTVAYTLGRPNRPADLALLTGRETAQLTSLNEDIFAHRTMSEVQEITYASSFDGEAIQAWYMTPPDFDPAQTYPLILEIHGGPHLAYGPVFSAEMQRMAAEGYVVFYANHRGSSGYGERFGMLLDGKYSSEEDFADHMSGIDAVIKLGFVDPERLYITGGSAGGIASAYAIGLTDRFKAAVVAKPVINWISKVLTADSSIGQIAFQNPGMPWDHVEHYWKRSPLSLVGNVTTPTMLITGENDRRTPMSETEQFYQALKLLRVDTVMVRVPGSSHAIAGRPSRLIAKVENIIAWFDKYDKPAQVSAD